MVRIQALAEQSSTSLVQTVQLKHPGQSQNGGRIQNEKMSIGQYGFIALVLDTEGNMIGLHSMQ